MGRQRTKQRKKTAHKQVSTEQQHKKAGHNRRDLLRFARNWGLFLAAAGGGGWYLADEVMATITEQDLSKIGNGIPAIVQIHDPQCSRCLELQRETRKAMKAFSGEELQYLVANIRSAKGRKLATTHGVGHITLVLFDGRGDRKQVIHGINRSDYLKQVFRTHVSRFSGRAGG